MTVDNGANSMTPGNEALPVQRSQNVPQLCAADAQHFRQYAFPGKPVTMGILPHLHSGEQLRPDAFGLSWILTHFGPPFRFAARSDYGAVKIGITIFRHCTEWPTI